MKDGADSGPSETIALEAVHEEGVQLCLDLGPYCWAVVVFPAFESWFGDGIGQLGGVAAGDK